MQTVYTDTKEINEYGLYAFMQAVVDAINHGYQIDFESNQYCPQTYGSLFTVVMVKPNSNTSEPMTAENQQPVSQELQDEVNAALGLEPTKRTRKSNK